MAVNYGQGGGQGGSSVYKKSFADMKGGVNAPSKSKKKKEPKSKQPSGFMSGIKSLMGRLNLTGPPTQRALDLRDKINERESLGRRIKRQRREAEAAEAAMQPEAPVTPPEAGIPSLRVTPEMRQAALEIFEAQQGAGQMPYYMAAARQGPNASPAFNYAAQNYPMLGGAQRLAPRPMEMMSVAERQQINRMAEGMLPQPMPTSEQQYQQGMDMVMRGGGKGGPAVMPQRPMPSNPRISPFASMLASRFGGFGGY